MARAKRHFIPGYIWHITHRCHKREFLLKFSRDRHRYLQWQYQARKRYVLIDYERLRRLIGSTSYDHLRASHRGWTEEYLGNGSKERQEEWTASVAVGERSFVERVKSLLGFRAKGRDVVEANEGYQLRERAGYYKADFGLEKVDIGPENTYFWDTRIS